MLPGLGPVSWRVTRGRGAQVRRRTQILLASWKPGPLDNFWSFGISLYVPGISVGYLFRKNILRISFGYPKCQYLDLEYPMSYLFVIWMSCIYQEKYMYL